MTNKFVVLGVVCIFVLLFVGLWFDNIRLRNELGSVCWSNTTVFVMKCYAIFNDSCVGELVTLDCTQKYISPNLFSNI